MGDRRYTLISIPRTGTCAHRFLRLVLGDLFLGGVDDAFDAEVELLLQVLQRGAGAEALHADGSRRWCRRTRAQPNVLASSTRHAGGNVRAA